MKKLAAALIAVFFAVSSQVAVGAAGVGDLRGRWEVDVFVDDDFIPTITMLINEAVLDGESGVLLASGCLESPYGGPSTPLAVRATPTPEGYFVEIVGTLASPSGTQAMRLTGDLLTHGKGISDDVAEGEATTQMGEGRWEALHHDRRKPKCSATVTSPLYFSADMWVVRNKNSPVNPATVFFGDTNILSSAMLVVRPDGSEVVVPPANDIWSADVDFLTQFAFVLAENVMALSGFEYRFYLLDAVGNRIDGIEDTDVFYRMRDRRDQQRHRYRSG